MSTPVIGLTAYNAKNKYGYPIAALAIKYISAISESGGIPVLIPSGLTEDGCQSLLRRLDGILLTGGGDIAAENNHEIHPKLEEVDSERDALEFALIRAAIHSSKPFFGICRGIQVINVALGGTLWMDIQEYMPGALKHDYDSGSQRDYLAHEVEVVGDSLLAGYLDEHKFKVNSLHHQGIKDLAPALRPAAYSSDGLVEAVELPDHPFGLAVQWHPEWLTKHPTSRKLFRAFVEAAGKE
jgi:putative glutamine amidotransferase